MACRIHAAAASCTAATTTASSSSAATGCVRCSGTGNSANVKPHDQVPLEIDGCESLVSVLNHYTVGAEFTAVEVRVPFRKCHECRRMRRQRSLSNEIRNTLERPQTAADQHTKLIANNINSAAPLLLQMDRESDLRPLVSHFSTPRFSMLPTPPLSYRRVFF